MATKVYTFIPEKGLVRITGDLNTRKGAPTRTADVVGMLHAGTTQGYIGYVLDGESVADIPKWYLTTEGDFFWSGSVDTHNIPVSGKIFARPLDALICTQKFGDRPEVYSQFGSPKGHNGLDFRTRNPQQLDDWKKPVYSVLDGTVSEAAEEPLHGKIVRILHSNGYESSYAHLSAIEVTKGQKVTAGGKIGISGNSGSASEAPHLHFEYRSQTFNKENGYRGAIDPTPYFKDEIQYLG